MKMQRLGLLAAFALIAAALSPTTDIALYPNT